MNHSCDNTTSVMQVDYLINHVSAVGAAIHQITQMDDRRLCAGLSFADAIRIDQVMRASEFAQKAVDISNGVDAHDPFPYATSKVSGLTCRNRPVASSSPRTCGGTGSSTYRSAMASLPFSLRPRVKFAMFTPLAPMV